MVVKLVVIGTIAAPIDEVIRGIQDVNQHTKYFPRLMEARLVSGSGNVRVVHQKIDVPFPLQDRYYDITTTGGWRSRRSMRRPRWPATTSMPTSARGCRNGC